MAVVRRNIATSAAARDAYVAGVTALKAENSGVTTAELGIGGGAAQPLSTWDLFVVWHSWAMDEQTPAGSSRNAAHMGPVFLPWHRWMLMLLEANLQRVLGDASVGLPYWDWAADGQRTPSRQPSAAVWATTSMGGNGAGPGFEVATGPFSAASGFRVRVVANDSGQLVAVNRPLRRRFQAGGVAGLPRKADVATVVGLNTYDAAPFDLNSGQFRNSVEGWVPGATAPNLHNRVHVWVGGDMSPASSPNDPVFFLNHCNVDRIWAAWQAQHPAAPYLPPSTAPASLFRHRLGDRMYTVFTAPDQAARPRDVLNVANIYSYDSLAVSS